MNEIYRETITLKTRSLSDLVRVLQNVGSTHQRIVGSGQDEMRRRGYLWMIAQQKLQMDRYPNLGETVTVSTWLSDVRHGMYRRHSEICTPAGELLIQAAAVWILVDAKTRAFSMREVEVPLYQSGRELPRFSLLRPMKTEELYDFTVPHEYIDANGHMNNAHYFDVVEPLLPENATIRTAQIDYHGEAYEQEHLPVGYTQTDFTLLVQARHQRGLCFRMKLEYQ